MKKIICLILVFVNFGMIPVAAEIFDPKITSYVSNQDASSLIHELEEKFAGRKLKNDSTNVPLAIAFFIDPDFVQGSRFQVPAGYDGIGENLIKLMSEKEYVDNCNFRNVNFADGTRILILLVGSYDIQPQSLESCVVGTFLMAVEHQFQWGEDKRMSALNEKMKLLDKLNSYFRE